MHTDFPDRQRQITRWMRNYGDTILRTCYLLCGDLHEAHTIVQTVFFRAYTDQSGVGVHRTLVRLLRLTVLLCPCRTARFAPTRDIACQVLRLPPQPRRAYLLCVYNDLTESEAAWVLNMTITAVRELLTTAWRSMR